MQVGSERLGEKVKEGIQIGSEMLGEKMKEGIQVGSEILGEKMKEGMAAGASTLSHGLQKIAKDINDDGVKYGVDKISQVYKYSFKWIALAVLGTGIIATSAIMTAAWLKKNNTQHKF
jgi:hypothetical protein